MGDLVMQGNEHVPSALDPMTKVCLATIQRYSIDAKLAELRESYLHDAAEESALTAARRWLLERSYASESVDREDDFLPFALALAEQCFLNEYCYWIDPAERVGLEILTENLASDLADRGLVSALDLAVAATYTSPSAMDAGHLVQMRADSRFAPLLRRTVTEPEQERGIAADIPTLTTIDDPLSRRVAAMYEENPYPRWTIFTDRNPRPLATGLHQQFPNIDRARFGNPAVPKVLIAGCGTGQHIDTFCGDFVGGDILAVDLSRASLAYAKRMTDGRGLNVKYGQADILEMGALGMQFDVIDCMGVLHHLSDPIAGWRALLACLRPGGVMRVGLYNFAARAPVRDAWRYIREHNIPSTPEGIRRFRHEIMNMAASKQPLKPPVATLARFSDFYTTSMCRDLAFHVREVQSSIADVFSITKNLGLSFIGLALTEGFRDLYVRKNPIDQGLVDLDSLMGLEIEHPEAFESLMAFGVQKP